MRTIFSAVFTLVLTFYVVHLGATEDVPKQSQSPIAISTSDVVVKERMKPLIFHGHWDAEGKATLENTATTVKLRFSDRTQPYLTGGPLKKHRYIFDHLHFHWAHKDKLGSEHTLDGKSYSMEAHLVHYNEKYGNFSTALTKKDGVAVTAFFIQANGKERNEEFGAISDYIAKIQEPGTKFNIDPSKSMQWIPSSELKSNYYTYQGSLTTPPYSECVTWIIYEKPIYVSKKQVDIFRHLHSDKQRWWFNIFRKHIRKNWRETQTNAERLKVTYARN